MAWLVAGAVRNTVWKYLYPESTLEVNDIDVPYFSQKLPMEMNQYFVEKLETIYPTGKWECDNEAWVGPETYPKYKDHMPNAPYSSIEDAMQDFWFTVNTIGLRLNNRDEIEILNPEVLPDLFNGILRVMPLQQDNHEGWFEEKIIKISSRCPQIKVIR